MKHHILEIENSYADAKLKGEKPFEIRGRGHDFQRGDTVSYIVIEDRQLISLEDKKAIENHPLSFKKFVIGYLTTQGLNEYFVAFGEKEL